MKNEETNIHNLSTRPRSEGSNVLVAGLLLAFAVVVIISAIVLTKSHKERMLEASNFENQRIEMATQLNQRDSIINEWVVAFNEIESDIKKITARENMLTLQSMDPEISQDKKEEILKEITLIRQMIDQNKKKISSLSAQLKNSNIKIASLQTRIDTLDAEIAQRDQDMASLKMELVDRNFEIGQLNEKVVVMESNIAEKDSRISQQTAEMNKAFVVSGTYKDLKEKGLLTKEGRVLGLGGKESLQENTLNDRLFTQVDISETRTIPVNSKDARLVTEHPANSYALIKDDDGKVAYVEIKDPSTFWKLSKYAVVEVRN